MKIFFIVIAAISLFISGRLTAPKPKPEVKIVTRTVTVQHSVAQTTRHVQQKKHVVQVRHTVKMPSGIIESDVKTDVTFDALDNTLFDVVKNKETKTVVTKKPVRENFDVTFMMGRNLNENKYDYLGIVGVPLFASVKADAGYEWNHRTFFVGGSVGF